MGVGSHQAALHREHQVVGGPDGPRTVGGDPAQSELQRPDVVRQVRRAGRLVGQPQVLDPLEQRVGLGQHLAPVDLGGAGGIEGVDECAHGRQRRGERGPG
jgi:hypothetical protein